MEELGFTFKYEMKRKLSLQQKLLPYFQTSCGETKSKTSDYSSVFLVLVKRDQWQAVPRIAKRADHYNHQFTFTFTCYMLHRLEFEVISRQKFSHN